MRVLKGMIACMMILLFACGFSIFAYPYIHNYMVERDMQGQIHHFLKQVGTQPTEGNLELTDAPEPPREHQALWDAMVSYNDAIWEEKQAGLCDPWAYQQPSFTLGEYGLEEEVFGVLSIPALDLEMPLYLGATASHMAEGAAHLSQTSLPIGGRNTNCVIAGHRGWNGADYFRYITELKPGDEVMITNLWETLTYRVTDTRIIMPNEVEQILIQEGRDMITLLTCHPYASGGKQRFLKYVSELLGKETIDTNTYGQSRGRNGSYSTNYQVSGRELMTPDEVRMLDNQYALLFIRGERPIRDFKYDILKHPNIRYTTDGGAPAYKHGEDTRSFATIAISPELIAQAAELEVEDHNFVLFCEEELEEYFENHGGN